MKTFPETTIQQQAAKASGQALETIFAFETADLIDRLTDQYGVPKEQKYLVAEEVLYVMLQLTSVPEMKMRLPQRVDLSSDQASRLVDELYENLFRDHNVRMDAGEERLEQAPVEPTEVGNTEFTPQTSASGAVPANIPIAPTPEETYEEGGREDTLAHEEDPTPLIPSYRKPLTDMPRYDTQNRDPYQEKPGMDEQKW